MLVETKQEVRSVWRIYDEFVLLYVLSVGVIFVIDEITYGVEGTDDKCIGAVLDSVLDPPRTTSPVLPNGHWQGCEMCTGSDPYSCR